MRFRAFGCRQQRAAAQQSRVRNRAGLRTGPRWACGGNGSFGIATLQNRHAGKDLFQYVAEDRTVVNIRRRHINEYIKEVMGERFSAKDFRTWAGTLIAACALARLEGEEIEGRTDRKKLMVAAIKETAAQLGNTPAVCKASYIWPSVLHGFEQGTVVRTYFKTMDELVEARTHGAEKALLELLKTGRSALPAPQKRARRRETKLSRRMRRSPRARQLARAFTVQ